MEEIKSSFWGYNKEEVKNILAEKNKIIDAQKKDIDFLRSLANEQHSKTKQDTSRSQNTQITKEEHEPEM